jgi:hypothetical protein
VPQGSAELALAVEQFDLLRVLAPAPPEYLDCHDLARVWVIGAEDSAKAAGGNLVQQTISTQEIAVLFALEQLVALKRSEEALSLESGHKDRLVGVAYLFPDVL